MQKVSKRWAYGEIGRRAGFRFQWGNPSEFESLYAHHFQCFCADNNFAIWRLRSGTMQRIVQIGRRAGFRFQWGNPSEFESLYAHHFQCFCADNNFAIWRLRSGTMQRSVQIGRRAGFRRLGETHQRTPSCMPTISNIFVRITIFHKTKKPTKCRFCYFDSIITMAAQ